MGPSRVALSVAMMAGGVISAIGGGQASAQQSFPDSVLTVFVTDTIEDFGAVGGVATDALGYVYIADFRNAVWRYSPDGLLTKFADGLYGASGNAIGPRGYLYQSSFYGNYVSRITRTGHWEVYANEGLSGPVGIAASPAGELFVVNCNANAVARIDTERRVTEFAKSELFACPNGITFDDRGDLYVVNFNNTKVVRVTPDGVASEFVDIPGAGGNGHITFTRGALFVTKFRGHQVFRVTRSGAFSVLAGTGQPGETDGPASQATLTRPNGIAASPFGNELWINDFTVGVGLGRGHSVVTMRKIKLVALSDVLTELGSDAGPDEIREAYRAYHVSRDEEDSSADAIQLGYQWLTAQRVGPALTLFELNAANFPDNANAQYHFGEAYRYTGQPDQAAEQYRKALALQPDHPQAAARLAALAGGGPPA